MLAARDVFNWGRARGVAIAPTVFIRSDIYEEISFPDKNKITQNLLQTLRWTDETEGEDGLKSLLDQRIRVITDTDVADPWTEVFDPALMRESQQKFKHIAVRTQLRPRDMIQFANYCLEEAKNAGADLIENHHIQAARPKYSEYLVNELDDEIHETFQEWRKLTYVLRRIHTMRFQRPRFDEFERARLVSDVRAEEALELLCRFSMIGFSKVGGGGYGGSEVAFRYRDPSVSFDHFARWFTVHPGLKEALELVGGT